MADRASGRPTAGYYEHARPEVAALVPAGARRVVDVGCGAGALGRALKAERRGVEVRGVEVVPEQAERARAWLDEVSCADAAAPLPASWPAPDCVVFADVLEHLVDPWGVLRAWRGRLAEGGTLVASVPNVACREVVSGLLRGEWRYGNSGILDRTHLRFFTRSTALELVAGAGFRVRSVRPVVHMPVGGALGRALARWAVRSGAGEPVSGARPGGPGRLARDLVTMQFLIVAG
jgi:2-polyprenyl-3-methyl-5-hydroxy-6-metoxy-1,4-benzoquinol methylase